MVMYWPEKKVALVIVDDPSSEGFDESLLDGWSILKTTTEQHNSLEGMRLIGDTLCTMLGQEPPAKTPEWLAANESLFNKLHGI